MNGGDLVGKEVSRIDGGTWRPACIYTSNQLGSASWSLKKVGDQRKGARDGQMRRRTDGGNYFVGPLVIKLR